MKAFSVHHCQIQAFNFGVRIERTAVSQNGLAALSDQSEGRGKRGGADGADEAGDSSDGELHFECG